MQKNHSKLVGIQALAAACVLGLLAFPAIARSYDFSGVGGSLGYASPEDLDGTAAVGVHAEFEQTGNRLHLDPNMRYWKVDGVRDVAPNMDLTYHFRSESSWTPYLGGGLGVNFVRDRRLEHGESDLGLNAIAGLRFPTSAGRYFLEGRYTASDVSQVALLTGITFHAR